MIPIRSPTIRPATVSYTHLDVYKRQPVFHVPVMTIESPVIVQITIVSINVPVIDTSPCLAGSLVCAAAAAIGALPSPDSFEKIPLAIPFCIAPIILPIAPPASALPVNADFTIVTIAAGIAVIFVTMIMTANTTYRTAMNGTTISDTFAILLIPPNTTIPTHTVSTRQDITCLSLIHIFVSKA